MEFSDESDSEANTQADHKTDVIKKRTTTRRGAQKGKTDPDPPADKAPPKRQTRSKNSTALPRLISSEDDETVACQPASARRGRTRRELARSEKESVEEPDKMRTIEEETNDVLDLSIEELRTSDTETDDNPASSKDMGT